MKRTVSLVYCFYKKKIKEIFNFKPFLVKTVMLSQIRTEKTSVSFL